MLPILTSFCFAPQANAVSISNQTFADSVNDPSSASCSYELNLSGVAYQYTSVGGNVAISGEWLTSGGAASFEARATLVSGTLSSGTTGSWLNLGTTRSWGVERASVGSKACTFDVEIRDATSLEVLDTARISITATVAPP